MKVLSMDWSATLTPSRICMDVCSVHSSRWRCSPLKSGHYFYGPSFLFVFDVCGVALRAHHPHTDEDLASHREEGLRPKSYYILFSFVEYVFADAQYYVKAPGSSCGAEGKWRDSAAGGHSSCRDPVCSQSAPCNFTVFHPKRCL